MTLSCAPYAGDPTPCTAGNTEAFINLQTNSHLDSAYGGYCVFAEIAAADAASFATVDAIAKAVKGGRNTKITSVSVQ